MSKKTTIYVQTLVILALTAVIAHYLAGLDWPWALVAGAALSIIARTLINARPAH
jgi:Kef-type K+ transport system membrane component KefB